MDANHFFALAIVLVPETKIKEILFYILDNHGTGHIYKSNF